MVNPGLKPIMSDNVVEEFFRRSCRRSASGRVHVTIDSKTCLAKKNERSLIHQKCSNTVFTRNW
jgi:hypothetical protein